jgi:hypothetical protein
LKLQILMQHAGNGAADGAHQGRLLICNYSSGIRTS